MDKRYGSWEDEQRWATQCTRPGCGATFPAGQGWVYGTALKGGIECPSCRNRERDERRKGLTDFCPFCGHRTRFSDVPEEAPDFCCAECWPDWKQEIEEGNA